MKPGANVRGREREGGGRERGGGRKGGREGGREGEREGGKGRERER